MSDTIKEMREMFRDSFMQPQCYMGADIEWELMQSGMECGARILGKPKRV